MTGATQRRFPYAPGLLGWVGGALAVAGALLDVGAVILMIWLVFGGTAQVVLVVPGVFALGMIFIAGAIFAWRAAWKRAGTRRPSILTAEQQAQSFREGLLVSVLNVLAFGAFAYLFLRLPGSTEHRLALAVVPILLSTGPSSIYAGRLQKRLNRPPKRFLGLPARFSQLEEVAIGLVSAVVALCVGLFAIPN